MSHEDKKKYKESIKPKTVRVRTKRTTTMSDKLKNRAFKKFEEEPKNKGVDEEITIDEHLKMNDNFCEQVLTNLRKNKYEFILII